MSSNTRSIFGFIKSSCVAVLVLAGILATEYVSIAHAAKSNNTAFVNIDLINETAPGELDCKDAPLESTVVTLNVSGGGDTPPGNVDQYGVIVKWGDGSEDLMNSDFVSLNGGKGPFTFTADATHEYGVGGEYLLEVTVFHSNKAGNDNTDDATETLDLCIFVPQGPELEITSISGEISGEVPEDTSCDAPLIGGVTIEGMLKGSAPPGDDVMAWGVEVDWDDGSAVEDFVPSLFPTSGKFVNFEGTWQTPVKTYDASGTYAVKIRQFWLDGALPKNYVADAKTVNICVFVPQAPDLQVLIIVDRDPATISCSSPLVGPVSISGTGVGSSYPVDTEDWGVEVQWGDGQADLATTTFDPPSGELSDFKLNFAAAGHTYDVAGSYTILINLFYFDEALKQNVIVLTESADICVFVPIESDLVIDLIDGRAPGSILCPDSPIPGPFTIVGRGEGSATQIGVEDFKLIVKWGDGMVEDVDSAIFSPLSGSFLHYLLDFETPVHEYAADGQYEVTLSILFFDPSGFDYQVAATETVDICFNVPKGTIVGDITDSDNGLPLFGAVGNDISEDPTIPASISGNIYAIDTPGGSKTLLFQAQGYEDLLVEDVVVMVGQVKFVDVQMVKVQSELNVVVVTFPIGPNSPGNGNQDPPPPFLLPPCLYAIQNGVIVQTVCVHAGNIYCFIDLPEEPTIFTSDSTFYVVGASSKDLGEKDNGDDAPNKKGVFVIDVPVDLPDQAGSPEAVASRDSVFTGSVNGTTFGFDEDGITLIPIQANVYVEFEFDGVPVTVTTISDGVTGLFNIDLLSLGPATIYADAGGALRSATVQRTILIADTPPVDLTVDVFDTNTDNFVPRVIGPTAIAMVEDTDRVLAKDDFTVVDLDDLFSDFHTLQVFEGFNYTRADFFTDSPRVIPDPNFNGSLSVPVAISDEFNTSSPFVLTINVNAVDDIVVYVDFDNGLSAAAGGTGTEESPFQAVGEAVGVVSPDGMILIRGIAPSSEPPLTINQPVTLQNNNTTEDPVSIAPGVAPPARATSTTQKSGFVSRTSSQK